MCHPAPKARATPLGGGVNGVGHGAGRCAIDRKATDDLDLVGLYLLHQRHFLCAPAVVGLERVLFDRIQESQSV